MMNGVEVADDSGEALAMVIWPDAGLAPLPVCSVFVGVGPFCSALVGFGVVAVMLFHFHTGEKKAISSGWARRQSERW